MPTSIGPESVQPGLAEPLDAGGERQRRWLATAGATAAAVLTTEPGEVPGLIARAARRVSRAAFVAVEIGTPNGVLVLAFDGPDAASTRGRIMPAAAAPLYRAVASAGGAVVFDDAAHDPRAAGSPLLAGRDVGPLLALPLPVGDRPLTVLLIGNRSGVPPFPRIDLELATAFARHVALAWELARCQRERPRPRSVPGGDRIAQDLHDVVLQRLFATGLRLQALVPDVSRPVAAVLDAATESLDRTMNDLRGTIVALQRPGRSGPAGWTANIAADL